MPAVLLLPILLYLAAEATTAGGCSWLGCECPRQCHKHLRLCIPNAWQCPCSWPRVSAAHSIYCNCLINTLFILVQLNPANCHREPAEHQGHKGLLCSTKHNPSKNVLCWYLPVFQDSICVTHWHGELCRPSMSVCKRLQSRQSFALLALLGSNGLFHVCSAPSSTRHGGWKQLTFPEQG